MSPLLPDNLYKKAREQGLIQGAHFHCWNGPGGESWALFYRRDHNFTIRFVGLADFSITQNAGVHAVYPVPGVSDEIVHALYCNHVFPLLLSHKDQIVLHASAVSVGGGAAIFLGPSGIGKSTLIASFIDQSYPFICDEAAVLELEETGYFVAAGLPTVHLCDDVMARNPLSFDCTNPCTRPMGKTPVRIEAPELYIKEPTAIAHIYLLQRSLDDAILIEPESASEAVVALLENSFMLDVEDRLQLERRLQRVSDLARAAIFSRLCYPHKFQLLPQVRAAVLKHLNVS